MPHTDTTTTDRPLTAWERRLIARMQAKIHRAIAERAGESTVAILNHIKATARVGGAA
jgi:hypothetical protein